MTAHTVTDADSSSVPIGGPEWNTAVYVLDSRLHPVPVGVPGELYLAGEQLARGYHARPALTAERFVAHPFGSGGERIYRTGDLVSWNRDGDLEYLCRTDFQVKVRGFRIELGEIEAALLRQDDVAQVAVVAHSDTRVGDRLVGYVVPAPGATVDHADLSSSLARELPSYMVPSASVVVAEIPRSSNGKLDLRALPKPAAQARAYRAPRTPVEQAVAKVYADLLEAGPIGLDDNFFELGGHSLLAAKAAAMLRGEIGTTVSLPYFFTHPTVGQLAGQLTQPDLAATDDDAALRPVVQVARGGSADPLFCVHPLSGLGWAYRELAARLDADVPIYALQTPAILEEDFTVESLDVLVTRYVDEIRRVQSRGPYRLLGWSLGGVLAHAIAARLQDAGEEVTRLVLVDAAPEIDVAVVRSELADFLAAAGISGQADPSRLSLGDAEQVVVHVPGACAQFTGARVQRMMTAALRVVEVVKTERTPLFTGDVLYLGAEHGNGRGADDWAPYVRGRIAGRTVPAAHDEMLSPAAVADYGPVLDRWLAQTAD